MLLLITDSFVKLHNYFFPPHPFRNNLYLIETALIAPLLITTMLRSS